MGKAEHKMKAETTEKMCGIMFVTMKFDLLLVKQHFLSSRQWMCWYLQGSNKKLKPKKACFSTHSLILLARARQ